ncbi:hypothetical protein EBQ93_01840 [bacterium]|nr:hypothetical protein [bacterium]
MKAFTMALLLMYSMSSFAQQKNITILVHGTGAGYTVKMAKQLRYCPKGLHHVELEHNHQHIGQYFLIKVEKLSTQNPARFDKEHFYTFGWSGKLGFLVRQQAGKELAQELGQLVELYKDRYGQLPHVQIITFSHGGNVALQIAEFKEYFPKELFIELIMLASPIQATTEHFMLDECFSKVYNIFSEDDIIQRIDPQNLYAPKKDKDSFFSRRTFSTSHAKCKQTKITVRNRGLGHLDMIHGQPILHLSDILQQLDSLAHDVIGHINLDTDYVRVSMFRMRKWLKTYCMV